MTTAEEDGVSRYLRSTSPAAQLRYTQTARQKMGAALESKAMAGEKKAIWTCSSLMYLSGDGGGSPN
jgi:hypothetical protein